MSKPIRCWSQALLAAVVLLGCAGAPAVGPAPSTPEAGRTPQGLLAALQHGGSAGARLSLDSLRALRTDVDPWREIRHDELDQLPEGALLAVQRCRAGGPLGGARVKRASWYWFAEGRLAAFEHWDFGPGCRATHHFTPAPRADTGAGVERERELLRHVRRAHPASAPGAAGLLAMGEAWVAQRRTAEASTALAAADEAIAGLEEADPEVTVAPLRVRRGQLARALAALSPDYDDPERRFWRGE